MFTLPLFKNITSNSILANVLRRASNYVDKPLGVKLLSSSTEPKISPDNDDNAWKTLQDRSKSKMDINSEKRQNFRKKTPFKVSERSFLVKAKHNPDEFGDGSYPKQDELTDKGDIAEERYFTEQADPRQKLRIKQYADMIKGFIRQRRIKDAIDVLEIKMLREDKVKPEGYIYNLLLGACGRVGYTKKAFMLYNDMKKRRLKVMGGTYTALFNACANSPWPTTDGLTRARHLHDIIIEAGHDLNDSTYNAMIKAFGRCGDLQKAFSLVDEMIEKRFEVKDDTINFLLHGCISDKEAGFRHSLLVWRKLMDMNIRPSIFTFNLLLKCTRECELGDIVSTQDVIDKLTGQKIPISEQKTEMQQLNEGHIEQQTVSNKENILNENPQDNVEDLTVNATTTDMAIEETLSKPKDPLDLRPNLLAPMPHLGSIISLSEVKSPEHRLLLLGGCKGFLETMRLHKCTPDIKTFTQLLECIPCTSAAEKELIGAMKKLNIKPDIDFYNMLIRKKSMRFSYEEAREVLTMMKRENFRPDLITYGVLALGCNDKEQALSVIEEMKQYSYTLNAVILGIMVKNACYSMNFDYIFEIMEICLRESVPVNKMFLKHLESFQEKMTQQKEAKQLQKKHIKQFYIFQERYQNWLTEVQIDETEEAHPWQQYRQNHPENVTHKPKDATRFKARHKSLYKVKTSTKNRDKYRK